NNNSFPTMTNVTATALDGSVSRGVDNNLSSPKMVNVTCKAQGATNSAALFNFISTVVATGLTATASNGTNNYGVYNSAGSGSYSVLIDNSIIDGSTNSIRNDNNYITRVGATKLEGGPVAVNGGTMTCVGVYDASYTAL